MPGALANRYLSFFFPPTPPQNLLKIILVAPAVGTLLNPSLPETHAMHPGELPWPVYKGKPKPRFREPFINDGVDMVACRSV